MKEIVTPCVGANGDCYLLTMKVEIWVVRNLIHKRANTEQKMSGDEAASQWTSQRPPRWNYRRPKHWDAISCEVMETHLRRLP
jgi:hypothetical protein